jgi:hypothetical protein
MKKKTQFLVIVFALMIWGCKTKDPEPDYMLNTPLADILVGQFDAFEYKTITKTQNTLPFKFSGEEFTISLRFKKIGEDKLTCYTDIGLYKDGKLVRTEFYDNEYLVKRNANNDLELFYALFSNNQIERDAGATYTFKTSTYTSFGTDDDGNPVYITYKRK